MACDSLHWIRSAYSNPMQIGKPFPHMFSGMEGFTYPPEIALHVRAQSIQ